MDFLTRKHPIRTSDYCRNPQEIHPMDQKKLNFNNMQQKALVLSKRTQNTPVNLTSYITSRWLVIIIVSFQALPFCPYENFSGNYRRNHGNQKQLLQLPSSWITVSIDGRSMGDSWVHIKAILASLAASYSENLPWRLASMKSWNLHVSAPRWIELVNFRFPERIWKTSTPNAYTSLFSVKRPVVVYSGARYPMAALALSAEKTMSSVRSLCRPESESRGLSRWSMSTFSAEMFW